tara:strand:+ start:466 stop:777 length:312 start_codon:yes stop_codon:yes gene_type:complete
MKKRYTNKKHLEHIHTLHCCVSNVDCSGVIQAHHLLKPFDGVRGMGMKANDKNLVPLCLYHHTELHRMGNEYEFSYKYFGLESQLKHIAQTEWLRSPYYEQNE